MNSNDTTTDGVVTGITPRTPKDSVLDWLGIAKFVTLIWGLAGAIGGLMLAMHSTGDSYYDDKEYPYIGYGVGVMATAVFSFIVTMAVLVALTFQIKEGE